MKTILLIEDDIVLREKTAELLELNHYKVITALNGAIGIVMANKYLPDIIVCDIMMPELDGYQSLKSLSKNKKTKYIPFIFLSAKTEHRDVRKGMNMGADDYISKPFSEEELIGAIESRLAKASILKDLWSNSNNTTKKIGENKIKTLNDLKNFFDASGTYFSFEKDTIIYGEGDRSNYIYLISKGAVKCYQNDEQGKQLVTGLYKEGDLFGYTSFTSYKSHKETAMAIDRLKLVAVSAVAFNEILKNNHKVALELMQLFSDDLLIVKNQLLEMAYGSVTRKTAATILKFAEQINSKPEDPIRISRSDLASVAGIATETLIRALTSFKKQGIIQIEGRNIRVRDLEKLKHMSQL